MAEIRRALRDALRDVLREGPKRVRDAVIRTFLDQVLLPLTASALVLVGMLLIVTSEVGVAVALGRAHIPGAPPRPVVDWSLLGISVIVLAIGVAIILFVRRFPQSWSRTGTDKPAPPPSIDTRLRLASKALQEARDVVAEVERELHARQARLDTLSAQYKQAEELAMVNDRAAAALRREFAEMKGESRRALWITIGTGLPFAVAGAVVGAFVLEWISGH